MNDDKLDPKFVQKPLRTYETDLAYAMARKEASAAAIAIAEQKKQEQLQRIEERKRQKPVVVESTGEGFAYFKQIAFALLGIIFIGGGAVGGYYLYKKSAFARPPSTAQPLVVQGIIPSDRQVPLGRGEVALPGKIIEFQSGLTASAFIEKEKIPVPDIIVRSISDRWMLGAYGEEDGRSTLFMALSTDFFQNVFAGMLAWETTSMPEDLAKLFHYTSDRAMSGTFSDKVIRNLDVREFHSQNGDLILLYSFVSKEVLVVTTTESALVGAIDRIEKQTFMR